jgi:hypothetical protein
MDSTSQNKIQKKRGRKPKIVKPSANNHKEDIKKNEKIILHLNITEEDLITKSILPQEINTIYHKYTENIPKKENTEYITYLNKIIEDRNSVTTCNTILFLEYNNANRTNKWPSKTNIDCLWDGHSFETCPIGIPIKKSDNIIYMFGNFCSPECAAAYNFSMNDDNVWERYSLLNEIYSNNNEPINIANSKLLLKRYGGIYSINEYRINNINTNYIINLPPVVSYIPTIEEISKNYTKTEFNPSIDINSEYNIYRQNKILNKKNSLENIMNIKYI